MNVHDCYQDSPVWSLPQTPPPLSHPDRRQRSTSPSFRLDDLESKVDEPVIRAYSMANYPGEEGIIMLNVRVASPPPRAPEGIPPGKVSSYIFNCKPGDEVTIGVLREGEEITLQVTLEASTGQR